MSKYKQYEQLNLPQIAQEVLEFWKREDVFQQSVDSRDGMKPFVFYEGPPSANGLPGIHHVMARAIKDIFCRYKTLKGYQVRRKGGWDTHGLPVELGVEKELGITKDDIGKKISVEEYNKACRDAVMRYTDLWYDLTEKMGYWVDMQDPYVTYDNKYIESVWWLLNNLYEKNLLYKGYTIQPYSPAAGTGLSSHELNQPGCYKDVKDTTIVAQFRLEDSSKFQAEKVFGLQPGQIRHDFFVLAWTTTPWTLPSNTALAVGPAITYVLVDTFNPYTAQPAAVILAKDRLSEYFSAEGSESPMQYQEGQKILPYCVVGTCAGKDLTGLHYEQLLPFAVPHNDADKAFRVIPGDFVTTGDGTGIVHIAPTFGADDMRVAREAGVPPMLVADEQGTPRPLVDLQGKFIAGLELIGGKFVKNEYYVADQAPEKSVDVEIAIYLKERGLAFRVEKYAHSYPHCWRTDKPVLYYPLDSWFIKTTQLKERLIGLNKEINWKPESTGTGRFGNWLENLQDWNLSRSRYWGIPIPIWTTEDKQEQICIQSVEQLKKEIEKSVQEGFMKENPLLNFEPHNYTAENYAGFDLHRPYADEIILVSQEGKPMYRETDLIDVWFDSGAMPYAQHHYPFENRASVDMGYAFPADFIAEGVDQTRGWFFTLHAIAVLCFDSIAYKNVVSNGLVLDKNGQKMSKRLGNAVDPFKTLAEYGPDATRWYMLSNAQPWDNLKFDLEGIVEVQRKFFRALYNTYSFFALYANIDGFEINEQNVVPVEDRDELDRWVISALQVLIRETDEAYENYDPTRATRAIQDFVVDQLSNWYVRLSRRRFWKGEMTRDKRAAYETLYECLMVVAQLMSPVSPFFAEWLYKNLSDGVREKALEKHTPLRWNSVHLTEFSVADEKLIDQRLIDNMELAQQISSMILALRKKVDIRVRQPLAKVLIPVVDKMTQSRIEKVKDIILTETNIKALEFVGEESAVFVKTVKPNFKALGPKYGRQMKAVSQYLATISQEQIRELEKGEIDILVDGEEITLSAADVEITTQDVPGWQVLTEKGITVALDTTLTEELIHEGIARELINRVQNLRKESGFDVTDKIFINIAASGRLAQALNSNKNYICAETLSEQISVVSSLNPEESFGIEIGDGETTLIQIHKSS